MYLLFIWGGTKWFWGGTIHNSGHFRGGGPKNRDFFGPLNGTSAESAIWAQKSRYVPESRYNLFPIQYVPDTICADTICADTNCADTICTWTEIMNTSASFSIKSSLPSASYHGRNVLYRPHSTHFSRLSSTGPKKPHKSIYYRNWLLYALALLLFYLFQHIKNIHAIFHTFITVKGWLKEKPRSWVPSSVLGFGTLDGWPVDTLALKLRRKGGLEPVLMKGSWHGLNNHKDSQS